MVAVPDVRTHTAPVKRRTDERLESVITAAQEVPVNNEALTQRDLTSRIANEIVGLHKRLRGRGPNHVRVHIHDDLVTVILREDLSPLERALVREGREAAVRDQRDAYEAMVAPELRTIVEANTERTVEAFVHAG
ncbi:MAG: DUF2294 family protein, partial [Solirubrobacteraceae bacterium]|nr:DUF2294 family protein [Solirubrobacteraceae bacterium]